MTKIDKYTNINQKPIETVYELKDEYQTPSFEEFTKTYERDEKVNYSDLEHSDLGDSKGYGPCEYYRCSQPSGIKFKLTVKGINEVLWGGSSLDDFEKSVYNVEEARQMIDEIDEGTGHWEDKVRGGSGNFLAFFGVVGCRDRVEVITRQIRDKLIELIRKAIREHEDDGQYVDGKITVRESGGGGLTWRTSY